MRIIASFALGVTAMSFAVAADPQTTDAARDFMTRYSAELRPLEIGVNRAWWDANITGADADFKRKEEAQNKLDAFLSEKDRFAQVKRLKESGKIDDPIVKRALDVIHLAL